MSYEQMQRAAYNNAKNSVEDYLRGEMYVSKKSEKETIGFWLLGVAIGMLVGCILANIF